MSEQMRKEFEAWCSDSLQRDPDGSYKQPFTRAFWLAWQAALATQPQAPQVGEITDAERYEFLCTCKDEVTMDFLAECIGSRTALSAFVDELIREQKSAPKPETPEVLG